MALFIISIIVVIIIVIVIIIVTLVSIIKNYSSTAQCRALGHVVLVFAV